MYKKYDYIEIIPSIEENPDQIILNGYFVKYGEDGDILIEVKNEFGGWYRNVAVPTDYVSIGRDEYWWICETDIINYIGNICETCDKLIEKYKNNENT